MKLFLGSLVGKLLLALVASLIAVATIQTLRVSWGHNREIKLREALRASEANLAIERKSSSATVSARTTQRAAQAVAQKEATNATKELDIALTASPDWADQPIPDDVAGSLRGTD